MITGPNDSLVEISAQLVIGTRELMREARSEDDLRLGFEKLLSPLLKVMGVATRPHYNRTILNSGRPDAVHGQVIIEYKEPRAFRSEKSVAHAFTQLVGYIEGEAAQRKDTLFLFDPKLVGVGFDGERIFFVRYQGEKDSAKVKLKREDFVLEGPYDFSPESARTLLTWMRALSRVLLNAENLTQVFGPGGSVAPKVVSALTDALEHWASVPRVAAFLDEWRRLFGIVYGEQFNGRPVREAEQLRALYGVEVNADFHKMLFSIHTYFALLMKLISAELLTISRTSFGSSFSQNLAHCNRDALHAELTEIEGGGVYAAQGVTNFLEGDFFRWYLDALSPRLEDALREMARSLSEFEATTGGIAFSVQRDLLKKLYQYLVPREIRHLLGEFYTPDWLAELVLDEAGYKGNSRDRLLDPACGSGTFLVLAIQRARQYAATHEEPPLETAKRIVANVWGFDLNPLAVIAARTNYLFALGDLASRLGSFEIPVYLADSVLWPKRVGQMPLNYTGGDHVVVPTSAHEFHVPAIWVVNSGFLMRRVAPLIERMVKEGFAGSEVITRLREEGAVFPPHERVVEAFYEELAALEQQQKNGIWARFLKNAFAPMVAGKFHYVVGNPPWIRWGYLSEEYRRATFSLWRDYGLFSLRGGQARLGAGEKDFSMLFTYAAIDYYLEKGGRLAFLITQEVFKSKGAGEGFRRFQLGENEHFRVLKAHDMVSVKPFEGAANKTAMIVLQKGRPTRYPILYTVWNRKEGVGRIPVDVKLAETLPLLQKRRLYARPMGKSTGSWQTVPRGDETLAGIQGRNSYLAHTGARTEPYGVFWLDVNAVLPDQTLLVTNLSERGKRQVQTVHERIEKDLIFPAVAGRDIARWGATPSAYILLAQDPQKSRPYPEAEMKRRWPRTYGYLTRFKDVLQSRGSRTVRQLAERTAFYAMFGVRPYTVARYKVVWGRMASDLSAAVVSQHKTPFGYKHVIPTDTTSLFATDSEKEAHYVCALLNSTPVREFVKSYSSAGRGFGAPAAMQHIRISLFDPRNKLHLRLAGLSEKLHQARAENRVEDIPPLEKQLDVAAAKYFAAKTTGTLS